MEAIGSLSRAIASLVLGSRQVSSTRYDLLLVEQTISLTIELLSTTKVQVPLLYHYGYWAMHNMSIGC